MLQIIFVCRSFFHGESDRPVGGGEISNWILFKELVRRGHKVNVISEDCVNEGVYEGIKVYPMHKLFPSPLSIIMKKNVLEELPKDFLSKGYKIIILSATSSVYFASQLAKKTTKPLGIFIRAYENFSAVSHIKEYGRASTIRAALRTIAYGRYGPKSVEKATFLIANSNYMKSRCADEFRGVPVSVVYPPLELQKHPIHTPDRVKSVTMIGDSERKGGKIFLQLAERFPDLEFRALGATSVLDLENTPKNISYLPWQDTQVAFRKTDLILVPSQWNEPFGRVAAEGLAAGRVTLVSDVGGLPEAVRNESILLVSDFQKVESWETALRRFFEQPVEFFKAAERASSFIPELSIDKQSDNFEYILNCVS